MVFWRFTPGYAWTCRCRCEPFLEYRRVLNAIALFGYISIIKQRSTGSRWNRQFSNFPGFLWTVCFFRDGFVGSTQIPYSLRCLAKVFVDFITTILTLDVATPMKLTVTFALIVHLNCIKTSPAAENSTASDTAPGFIAFPTACARRTRGQVRRTIIGRVFQKHNCFTGGFLHFVHFR